MIYRFDDIEIDSDRFELRRAGVPCKVEPQVFSLLELLVSNHDRLITKDELNLRIWGGRVVSEAVVNSRIRSARLAIGDNGKTQRLIQTVHNRGFRFIVTPEIEDTVARATATADPQLRDPADGGADGEAVSETGPSIAVLPFQRLTSDPRYDMFADAVAHEVIGELSRLHWLFVIARGSSFRFRGPDVDLRQAGEVLGARYFLTGSVAIEGGRSVVTAELCQAGDNRVLWAERFEGAVDALLELRLTIAAQIVTALEFRIPMVEARRAASLPTANLDAWSAYHRGLWHMYRFNAHDNALAGQLFSRAVTADPDFARAYAGLSFTHFQNAFVGYTKDPATDRHLSADFAEKGMALDPLDPFTNLTMGRALMLSDDLEGSHAWFDRSVELNPNYAFAIYSRALADAVGGAGGESEAGAVKAMRLSPIDPLRYAMLATRALSHIVRGDHAAACAWAEQGVAAPNAHVHIRTIAALANELAGRHETAQRWAATVRRNDPGYSQQKFLAAFPFRDDTTRGEIQAALQRLAL
jgi:TolB-like protein